MRSRSLSSWFSRSGARPWSSIAILLILGLALRLWHLDSKPLWLDEVLTALFTMGRSYQDVPLDRFFPLSDLSGLFTVQPGLSCRDITQRLATESVHPPLFFCLLYGWMSWLRPENWVWGMRFLPVLFGVGGIAAIYRLNRIAFSRRSGLAAAGLMALSPFAVYLSQEARHYTLPMLLITLALTALVQIQQDLLHQKLRLTVWIGWGLLNLIGLYTHYFCLLALIAQIAALTGWLLWRGRQARSRDWLAWSAAILTVAIGYLPWVPTLISHFSRPETDWLIPYKPDWLDRLAPLYRTLVGWTLMVIALPVEEQATSVVIGLGLLMLGFMVWLGWQVQRGWRDRWQQTETRPALVLIASFTGGILLQFLAIIYLLDKDLTVVPRYHFIYYPGVCALLAACLVPNAASHAAIRKIWRSPLAWVLLAGWISSIGVVNGLVFQKSYFPDRVAANLAFDLSQPLAVVMTYRSPQEVALGLSFALELQKHEPLASDAPVPPAVLSIEAPIQAPTQAAQSAAMQFAFLDRSTGYQQAWDRLKAMPQPLLPPLNLWIFASPGMRTKDYPQRLNLMAPPTQQTRPRMRCLIDADRFERVGFPYQLFRCQPIDRQSK